MSDFPHIRVTINPPSITPEQYALVTLNDIRAYLPPPDRNSIRKISGSISVISQLSRRAITAQSWADAIGAYAMAGDSRFTAESPVSQGPLYLASNSNLYRLVPVAATGRLNALSALRRRVLDSAQAEAESITASARQTSQAMLREAQQALAEATRRTAAEPPPEWTHRYGVRRMDNRWFILMGLTFTFTRIYTSSREYSVPNPAAHTRSLWVPLNFNVTAVRTLAASGSDQLPHVIGTASCLSLGTNPPATVNPENYANVRALLSRACSEADLGSLFGGINSVIALLPPDTPDLEVLRNDYRRWMEEHGVSIEREEVSTWSA